MCKYVYTYDCIHIYIVTCVGVFTSTFGRIRVVAVGRGRVLAYKEVGDLEKRTKIKQVIERSSVQSSYINAYTHTHIYICITCVYQFDRSLAGKTLE